MPFHFLIITSVYNLHIKANNDKFYVLTICIISLIYTSKVFDTYLFSCFDVNIKGE
jgi:hypothetical protein